MAEPGEDHMQEFLGVARNAAHEIGQIRREVFPKHAITAEESGAQNESSHRWIVDPLDGTTNFLQGIAHYCVSIALEVEGRPELGVIYYTPGVDLYRAVRADGTHLNDDPLSASRVGQLDRAVIAANLPIDDFGRETPLMGCHVRRDARLMSECL